MHHFEHKDGHINYNSDLSGELQVVNSRGEESWVSGSMLIAFIVKYIRLKKISRVESTSDDPEVISKLEKMSDDEIMGVAYPDPTTPEENDRSSTKRSLTR